MLFFFSQEFGSTSDLVESRAFRRRPQLRRTACCGLVERNSTTGGSTWSSWMNAGPTSPANGSKATSVLVVENPADESIVADVSGHAARRGRAGDRRGPPQLRRGRVGRPARAGAGRASCTTSSTTSRRRATTLVPTIVAEAGQPTLFAEDRSSRGGRRWPGRPSTSTCR